MNNALKFIIFALTLVILTNCKSKKGLIKDIEAADIAALAKADSVISMVKDKDFDFDWLSLKVKTKYKTSGGESQSFKTYLRIRKDSAIWATVTYLNVPVMTTIMTPDSVKILNKKDKKYFLGTFDFITDFVKTPIDYYHIQNLFVGNPISLDTAHPHYIIDKDNDIYLSSIKQSELDPILNGDKVHFGWIYKYWFNELYKPGKTILNNPGNGNNLTIIQNDYKKITNIPFPNKTEATFTSQKDTIEIKLNYSRVKANSPQAMPFKIPSKYTPYEDENSK